jgi:hypothetical protein
MRVDIDGNQYVLRVVAADAREAERHIVDAFDEGRRIEHTTPDGPLRVDWSRVAVLGVHGPLDTPGGGPAGPGAVDGPPADSVLARNAGRIRPRPVTVARSAASRNGGSLPAGAGVWGVAGPGVWITRSGNLG